MQSRNKPALLSMAFSAEDKQHMQAALRLAETGLGKVAPNPSVGCLIVKSGQVIARGRTRTGGRPHGETVALATAQDRAKGATAYITLEPCAHWGQTPPCCDALIEAKIARVVIAVEDPDPRVLGKSIEKMRKAGIVVDVGLCREEAISLNAGFFMRMTQQRPMVSIKIASTLDGRIALRGQSKWITGIEARRQVHFLRSRHDAILVGASTAKLDDPHLNVRLPGYDHPQPIRIVLSHKADVPLSHRLVQTAKTQQTWFVVGEDVEDAAWRDYKDRGVKVLKAPVDSMGRLSVPAVLNVLCDAGITRLMVEGGAQIFTAFLKADCVDTIEWFLAGSLMGSEGQPAIANMKLSDISSMQQFYLKNCQMFGNDICLSYKTG